MKRKMTNRMTMETDRCQQKKMLSAVNAAGSVLLFCHVSPDGDTLGSALALRLRLMRMGKRADVMLDGSIPQNMRFLPGVGEVRAPGGDAQVYDLAMAVDVSCHERLGACEPLFLAATNTAQVDHHASNEGFAHINLIDGDAPATAVLVYRLFEQLHLPLTRDEAVCLYTALSTDTGNFIYESTNAECFRMMAALMEAGLPLAGISRALFRQKELPFVRLLGEALPSLRLTCDGGVAGLSLTLAQISRAGACASHADGVVDYAIDLEGVKLAYFARETDKGRVKFSLRSLEPYHVDAVAAQFGGGGHKLASGLTVDMPIAEAVEKIEAALSQALRGPA